MPYLGAIAVVAAATGIRFLLDPILENRQAFGVYIVGVAVVARYFGFAPSVLAVLLSAFAGRLLFLLPRWGLWFDSPADQVGVVIFCVIGLLIALLMRSEGQAHREAKQQTIAAVAKQRQLEQEVAERKRIEAELRASEVRLLLALEAGRMGIWTWDLATNRVRSSETQAVIHGRLPTQTDTRIDDADDNIHPDDKQIVKNAIALATGEDAVERVTYRVVWPDESIHWIEAVGRAFRDESGKPVQVTGVCTDITERKNAENALRESEERFRLLAMHAPVGIALCDVEGRTRFVNPKACEMAGASPEEVMAFDWQEFIHPDDRENLFKAWQADIALGKIHSSAHFRFARKDGTVRWASTTASLIHDADGNPIGQIGITKDITENKAAEDMLRAREAQLSGILDNTSALVYLKNPEGRYLLTNRRFQTVLQQGRNDIIGKTDEEFFPEALARTYSESDAKVWREQCPIDFEEAVRHADGLHTYRSVKFPVRDETGKMIALGGISTDISDLKESHEALQNEQGLLRNLIEIQEKERQFLCHEFHDGLIQYAVGSLMLLSSCRDKYPTSEAAATVDTVIANLQKGVEDGRRVIRGIRPAVLDDSGIAAAVEDLVGQFETSGMHVTSQCDPEIGRLPESIQTTVYRVVQEALNNARKHSGTDVVRIVLKKVAGELHVEIRDFGCGFDVEPARKRGFGLLGMMERVRLLGGECLIQSQEGQGTCIAVRLPLPAEGNDA